MTICFICTEIFAWGKYGGFGRATRLLGKELVTRGVKVCAVVPRREDQNDIDVLDGITVYSYPKWNLSACKALFGAIDADIFHSEQASLGTYLAMSAQPTKKHLITSRDPKTFTDWMIEMRSPSVSLIRSAAAYFYENNYLVKRAVRKADGVYYCARYLETKLKRVYSFAGQAEFLPTPVVVHEKIIKKNTSPTVCFLARWDKRKRPERFFELAKVFPDIQFIAPGKSQNQQWGQYLRKRFGSMPNVEMPGFIDQFSHHTLWKILEKSWILVNTATREGLPTSFLEALAHQCAILSKSNPESITERFGVHVQCDEFEEGLERLLSENNWQQKGKMGYQYVLDNYELNNVIDQHLKIYSDVLSH
jgi:glycosyltransferase involved in cell wall biosynthesis